MLRKLFKQTVPPRSPEMPAPDVSPIDARDLTLLLRTVEGLPHVDWDAVAELLSQQSRDSTEHPRLRRAVAVAWLDALANALPTRHERWRHHLFEGLAPAENCKAALLLHISDTAARTVASALEPLRGPELIRPAVIMGFGDIDSYYSFVSQYYPDQGEWGTSGGMYINEGPQSVPLIIFPMQLEHDPSATIAHELTHHALHDMRLPSWAEEGLTQMMEERVTGTMNFWCDREMLEKHRRRWRGDAIDRFESGESFHASSGDEQELSYHLAQMIVRSWLTRDPLRFFAFGRACRDSTPARAAMDHLGASVSEMIEALLNPGRPSKPG